MGSDATVEQSVLRPARLSARTSGHISQRPVSGFGMDALPDSSLIILNALADGDVEASIFRNASHFLPQEHQHLSTSGEKTTSNYQTTSQSAARKTVDLMSQNFLGDSTRTPKVYTD